MARGELTSKTLPFDEGRRARNATTAQRARQLAPQPAHGRVVGTAQAAPFEVGVESPRARELGGDPSGQPVAQVRNGG